ncbi:MAG TPA: hypothetical protein VLE27_00535 [Thermoanaerobaculia bacterium]|nr:hypothetical protein [Thermoanaerobaculia bacterium]
MTRASGELDSVEWWRTTPSPETQGDAQPRAETGPIDLKRNPYWNVWVEQRPAGALRPSFEPLPHLEPDSDYLLVLDLAALRYRQPGVAPGLATPPLTSVLSDLLAKEDVANVTLTALIVPDGNLFASPVRATQELKFDLARVRKWLRRGNAPIPNAWEVRKVGGAMPDFLFGTVPFELSTLSATGSGWVVISLWLKGHPLGEVPVLLCVADDGDCDNDLPRLATVRGDWNLAVASLEEADLPDASLHFVDLPSGPVGVFWCEKCPMPGYKAWRLNRPLAQLSDAIKQILGNIKADEEAQQWRASGDILFKNLFTGYGRRNERNQVEEDRHTARVAFAKFLASRLGRSGDAPLGRIFVRLVVDPGVPIGRLPLGIMNVRDILKAAELPAAADPEGDAFLGFRFLIEAPLPEQRLTGSETCISRWYMALPVRSSDTDLKNAVTKLGSKIQAWQDEKKLEDMFLDMPSFGTWLADEEPLPASALVVLSHHDPATSRLFYEQDGASVVPAGVLRTFNEPSLVILDGCRTGMAGMSEYSAVFNKNGFSTAIVTATNADPYLAGDFLECLADKVSAATGPSGRLVSEIFFETLKCAGARGRDEAAKPYGPNALTFLLLGNGNLRLCAPIKEPKS